MKLLADPDSSFLLRRRILKSMFQRPLLPLHSWLFLLWVASRAVRYVRNWAVDCGSLCLCQGNSVLWARCRKAKMVGDGIAEVVNIPAKCCCEQKAEPLVIGTQKILYSLLKNDETLVLCPVLIVVANTPVDMNTNRFWVPSDKRLITLLNYNLFFS